MDLSALDVSSGSNAGKEVEILHPTKRTPLLTAEGEKITVIVIGKYSDEYQKHQRAVNNRRLAQRGGRGKVTAEEIEAETIEMIARCIKGWKNVTLDGKMLECNYANAVKVLSDSRLAWQQRLGTQQVLAGRLCLIFSSLGGRVIVL